MSAGFLLTFVVKIELNSPKVLTIIMPASKIMLWIKYFISAFVLQQLFLLAVTEELNQAMILKLRKQSLSWRSLLQIVPNRRLVFLPQRMLRLAWRRRQNKIHIIFWSWRMIVIWSITLLLNSSFAEWRSVLRRVFVLAPRNWCECACRENKNSPKDWASFGEWWVDSQNSRIKPKDQIVRFLKR